MSENFEMLVDVDVSAEQAQDMSCVVLDRFRKRGLITGEPIADCVLGGLGYRPGAAVPKLYKLFKREGRFWERKVCGVEPEIGKSFNVWALGTVCEGFVCPACAAEIEPFRDVIGNAIAKALGEWTKDAGPALVRCPKCGETRPITQWHCKPPLGLGNLSFRFWNWPPLDSSGWKIDLGAYVREITGHVIVRTHGHI